MHYIVQRDYQASIRIEIEAESKEEAIKKSKEIVLADTFSFGDFDDVDFIEVRIVDVV